jgi:hypothetical protein
MTKKNLKNIITEKAFQLEFDKIGFANPLNKVDSNNYFDELSWYNEMDGIKKRRAKKYI